MIRIVLADDHEIVRTGFRALIEKEGDCAIVAECARVDAARVAVRETQPDVLVLDLSLPGGGLSIVAELREAMPELAILVLTMHEGEPYVSEALRRGVHGYVTKGSAADELITALRAVSAGQQYLSTDLRQEASTADADPGALSEREREVFLILARGATPKEVAHLLGISVKTAYLHRTAVRGKLGARNDLDLHRIALERGLLR